MRKANAKTTTTTSTAAPTITQEHEHTEHTVAYIHGRIEAQLEGFAASLGLPARQLTVRVAALLLGPESGGLLGSENRVSSLPGASATADKATRTMAVAKRPYRKARRPSLQRGAAAYWAAMTPSQRSKEMQRRMKVRQSKLVAAAKKEGSTEAA
jgi:hypothetical protein